MLNFKFTHFSKLNTREIYQILALRQEVFMIEQNALFQDADGTDFNAYHLIGTINGELCAYLRVYRDFADEQQAVPHQKLWVCSKKFTPRPQSIYLGRVVVRPSHRGFGYAKMLMDEGIKQVEKTFGAVDIVISAQAYLKSFYEGYGFVQEGEVFILDNIEHMPMRRAAQSPSKRIQPPSKNGSEDKKSA